MTNLHDITELLKQAFEFSDDSQPETNDMLRQLLATLLERLVTGSYSYLSSEDQQILDGMLDAGASPEDVVGFLAERVPTLSEVVVRMIAQVQSETNTVFDVTDGQQMIQPTA